MKIKAFEKCGNCNCFTEMQDEVLANTCTWCGVSLTHDQVVQIYDDRVLIRELLDDDTELNAIGIEKPEIVMYVVTIIYLIPLLLIIFTSLSGWILTLLAIIGTSFGLICCVYIVGEYFKAKKLKHSIRVVAQKSDYSLAVMSSKIPIIRQHIADNYENEDSNEGHELERAEKLMLIPILGKPLFFLYTFFGSVLLYRDKEDLFRDSVESLEKLKDYILIKGEIY